MTTTQRTFLKRGNSKLGKDTLVFNMTSATDCSSKKLGLCKCVDKCYAMKAERQYHHVVLPFRRWQETFWTETSCSELIELFRSHLTRRYKVPVRYVRFSEAGDFRSQEDVMKLFIIAAAVPELTFYGYTARSDLDFSDAPLNVVVNGSGFMIHNKFTAVAETQSEDVCGGDCPNCNLCKVRGGKDVEIKFH